MTLVTILLVLVQLLISSIEFDGIAVGLPVGYVDGIDSCTFIGAFVEYVCCWIKT